MEWKKKAKEKMSSKLMLCAPLTLLLACGQPQKPTKDKEKEPAKTAPTSAAVKPTEPKKPETPPASASMPSTSASAPASGSVVFFAVATPESAVPMACYDATTKTLAKTSDCLEIVPKESTLGTSEGKPVRSKGRNTYTCEPTGDSMPSLELIPDPTRDTWPVAFWPESVKPQWFLLGDKDFKGLEFPEKAELQAAAKKAEPKASLKGFKVHQIVSVDLDGDGKNEELVSAYSLSAIEDQSQQTFGGLFLRDATNPKQFNPISTGMMDMYEVVGVYDLDQDGKKELILYIYYYEGGAYSIGKLDAGKYVELGVWGCGA